MSPSSRPVADEPSAEIDGLTGDALRAVGALWRRTARQVRARFAGTSMRPTIPPEAEIVLSCGAAPALGDIVAFVTGERLVLHRVVALSEDPRWILTCGDAVVVPDPLLRDPEAVIGVVAAVRRGDALVAPPPAPRSLPRRLLLAPCVLALRADPALGALLLRTLIGLRRWLVYGPLTVVRGLVRS